MCRAQPGCWQGARENWQRQLCGMNPPSHLDSLSKTAISFLPYFAYPFEAGCDLFCGGCIAAQRYIVESPLKMSLVWGIAYLAKVILHLIWEEGKGTVPWLAFSPLNGVSQMQRFVTGHQVPLLPVVVETSGRQEKQTVTMISICLTAPRPACSWVEGGRNPVHLIDEKEGALAKLNSLDITMKSANV